LEFNVSEKIPLLNINGKEVMRGYIDKITGKWIYNLTINIEDTFVNLKFIGCTKGWKGYTDLSGWGVILPKAYVDGYISFDHVDYLSVDGIGYHDHNWEITVFTGLNFGWLWGKLNTESFILTWSNILTTWYKWQPLLVINLHNDGYYGVKSEELEFIIKKIKIVDWFLIPTEFYINVKTNEIEIHLNISVIDTHYVSVLGIINYWRYHTQCKGSIRINSIEEIINSIDFAEFIRFRFY
jgi:hypothetical protein